MNFLRQSVAVSALCLFAPGLALGCTAEVMAKTEVGFVRKIIAGSSEIKAYEDSTETTEAFTLELMQPYYVICDAGEYLRITNLNAATVAEAEAGVTGFVRVDQVFPWPTREALDFGATAFVSGRPEIVAWDDPVVLDGFMETGNARVHAPAFRENIDATLKRERATRPYPVMASEVKALMGSPKRVYNVLVPTAIRPTTKVVIEDPASLEVIESALTSASILVVFDATGSMETFALETAKALSSAITSLPAEVRDSSQMGFVFYRDDGDAENLVELPMMSLTDAAKVLADLANPGYMTGGGDNPEPILDAIYYGTHLYQWGDQIGKRIMIGVLNGDAKPMTIGTLSDGQDRIPGGLGPVEIAQDLVAKGIPIITVQAGPDKGENLEATLSLLAEETASSFVSWDGAGINARLVAEALTVRMSTTATEAIADGRATFEDLEFDLNGFPTIPLEVMDGEKLNRLREAGIAFNITDEAGGVLVREAYMLENTDLLEPKISIEKDTLEKLINLFTVLAVTGADPEELRKAIVQAVGAIAGEDFDPDAPLKELVEKQTGIQFRTELLNFNIEYITTLNPAERNAYAKRIQDAAGALSQFFDANLETFDTEIAVWMPVNTLP